MHDTLTSFEVKRCFIVYLFGISLISCGNLTLLNLQSSLNVEDGLGTTSLTVLYGISLVATFLLIAVLHFASIKTGMIIYDVSAVIYCAVNYYPEIYTLLPGSALVGIGKSFFYVCSGCFVVHFAKTFEQTLNGSLESYFNDISGYAFASMDSSSIIGNLIQYFVFASAKSQDVDDFTNSTAIMTASTMTSTDYTSDSLRGLPPISERCGANDCQDPTITDQTISNYVPPDPITLYIVFSVFLVLSVIGLILHVLFAPSGEAYNDVEPTSENVGTFIVIKNEFIETLKHFIKPNQLLLMGLQFHAGMDRSFVISEMTRSFVSCIYGVTEVGLCMTMYGLSIFVSELTIGKVSGRYGRNIPVILGFLCNASAYAFCLLWVPSENSSVGIAYGLFIVYGIVDAIWMTVSIASVAVFFHEESRRGYTCWLVCNTLPYVVQTAWSTSVCVNIKIYVLFGSLITAVATQLIVERKRKRFQIVNKAYEEDSKSAVTAL